MSICNAIKESLYQEALLFYKILMKEILVSLVAFNKQSCNILCGPHSIRTYIYFLITLRFSYPNFILVCLTLLYIISCKTLQNHNYVHRHPAQNFVSIYQRIAFLKLKNFFETEKHCLEKCSKSRN